jgi:hypothetical protein
MSTAVRRRRTTSAVALSLIAHLAVLTVLVLHTPLLRRPAESSGPPEPIIPILILPRVPPPPEGQAARPTPVRLHRRPLRHMETPLPVEPLPAPPEVAGPPPKGPERVVPRLLLPEEGPRAAARTALRQGPVGCANSDAVNLSAAERELCNEQFGRNARTGPFLGLGLRPDKQETFDKAATAKEADRRYRGAGIPSGVKGAGLGEPEPWTTRLP